MVRFDEYDTLARVLRRLLIRNVHFRDGFDWREYFGKEPRALIVANHGPFLGPLAWVPALFPRIVDMGFGHLRYSAIAHPVIRNIPWFARMVGFERRGGQRLRTADYVALFERGELDIVSVAPEGEFSLYGNGVDIQPFRSCRSLEIGLLARCRIILAVARGLEHWHRAVSIEGALRKQLVKQVARHVPFVDRVHDDALDQATHLSISALYGRIPDLYVATELYEPELRVEDLAEDRSARDEQLRVEGDRMRREMMRMVEGLREPTPSGPARS